MAEQSLRPAMYWTGRIFTWLFGLGSFGVLVILLGALALRFVTPIPALQLQLVQGLPLPDVVPSPNTLDPQDTAQATRADRFDFQALDVQAGLLFIAHPGPTATNLQSLRSGVQLHTSIVVFDTKKNQVVKNLDVPSVHGLAIAPELHRAYAADSKAGLLYIIDEQKFTVIKAIKLSQSPDGLEYDRDDGVIFAVEPGSSPGNGQPFKSLVEMIDTQTNAIIQTIPFTNLGLGHLRYDDVAHRAVVVVVNPQHQSELDTIDPTTGQLGVHLELPNTCVAPHGLVLDAQLQAAFVACVDSHNLVAVDLVAMKVVSDPQHLLPLGVKADMLAIDHNLHVLFVGSTTWISVFDESKIQKGILLPLGDYRLVNGNMHTVAVDEARHNLYTPIVNLDGSSILVIGHFDPTGTPARSLSN